MKKATQRTKKSVKAKQPTVIGPDDINIKSIAVHRFTRDECLIIESFLNQFDMRIDASNKAYFVQLTNPKVKPIMRLNRATFAKLRYKIENIINPKNI